MTSTSGLRNKGLEEKATRVQQLQVWTQVGVHPQGVRLFMTITLWPEGHT